MTRLYRNNEAGYVPTEGMRDRVKKAKNPGQPWTGSRIIKYARKPFTPGIGLLYHIDLNLDGSSIGWADTIYSLVSYNNPDSVIRLPEGTLVYITPVFYHARYDSRAWSGGAGGHSLRYRLRASGDVLFERSKLLNMLDGSCHPKDTNIFTNLFTGKFYLRELSGSMTNINFKLDRINRPTSTTNCNQPQFRAGFYIRLVGLMTPEDVIINEAAFIGIDSVSLVDEFSFLTPPPPPAPSLISVETASETIRASCFPGVSYIKRFNWYLDDSLAKSTKKPNTIFTGLENRKEYKLTVKSIDSRGQESEFSLAKFAKPEDPNILYTDFSEYEPNEFPENWKDIWVTGNPWLTRTGQSSDWDGNAFLYHNQTSDQHDGLIWLAAGELTDTVITCNLNPDPGLSGIGGRVLFRCADTGNSNKTCYEVAFIRVSFNPDEIRLRKFLNNSVSTLDTLPFPGGSMSNVIYTVKISAIGSDIKVKVWLKEEEEPEEWATFISDEDIPQGFVGIAGFKGGSQSAGAIEFDSLEVAKL